MLERPPLSLALAALRGVNDATHPRQHIEWAVAGGFRSVTLDAATPGFRPRELDRSGRRDLAALLRRLELGLMGVDLWIPPTHFGDAAHAERAVEAAAAAIDLVADLAGLNHGERVISLSLPRDREEASAAISTIAGHADSRSVEIADHCWPPVEARESDAVRVGLDPAALLLAGDNPAKAAARTGDRLAVARLSDASDIGRVAPGGRDGRLNDLAYVIALVTATYRRPVVLDTRGLPAPGEAALRCRAWWSEA
ncbi:MAG: hypothetical protein ACF8LK_02180 [Phycisphaerales bacterium JB041]